MTDGSHPPPVAARSASPPRRIPPVFGGVPERLRAWAAWGALTALIVLPGCGAIAEMSQQPGLRERRIFAGKPPYVRNLTKPPVAVADTSRIGLLPVDNSPSLSRNLDLAAPLDDLYERIDDLIVSHHWAEPVGRGGTRDIPLPELYLGDMQSWYSPERSIHGTGLMIVTYDPGWVSAVVELARSHRLDYVLFLMVTAGDMPMDKGFTGSRVKLGTGHERKIGSSTLFFGADSASMIAVCGALVDASGTIVRVGGEGIFAADPELNVGKGWTLGADFEMELENGGLKNYRRESLPGAPPAWEVATQNLVSQLLGRGNPPLR